MTLTVTAGSASADSYGTLADFKTYVTAMGLTTTAADAVLEAHLRRAAVFLDRTFEWKGYRRYEVQALAWPRVIDGYDRDGFAIPTDTIPLKVTHAQFEIAVIFENGSDLLAYTNGPEVKIKEVQAGPTKVRTEYVSGSEDTARIRAIEGLLRDFVLSGGSGGSSGTLELTRA